MENQSLEKKLDKDSFLQDVSVGDIIRLRNDIDGSYKGVELVGFLNRKVTNKDTSIFYLSHHFPIHPLHDQNRQLYALEISSDNKGIITIPDKDYNPMRYTITHYEVLRKKS